MTYTAIFKINEGFTLNDLTQECLTLFGEGAREEFDQEEMAFKLCNSRVEHQHIRIIVAEHIATALQWMQDNGITGETGELIRVERQGLDMVPGLVEEVVGYTDEPESIPIVEMVPGYVKEPFKIADEPVMVDGQPTGETRPVYLGRVG